MVTDHADASPYYRNTENTYILKPFEPLMFEVEFKLPEYQNKKSENEYGYIYLEIFGYIFDKEFYDKNNPFYADGIHFDLESYPTIIS